MTDENTALAEDNTPPKEAGFFVSDDQGHENQENNTEKPDRDFEAEARDMGWVPEEDFRGDPDKWVDAEEFVTRGETFIPFLRANNRKLEDQLKKEREDNAARFAKLEKVTAAGMKQMKERHEAELASVKERMRQAVQAGDVEAYDKLSEQHEAIAKNAPEDDDEESPDDMKVIFDEWVGDHSWFNENFDMNQKATKYSDWLFAQSKRKGQTLSFRDNLKQTEDYMRKEHPELFGDKPATQEQTRSANGHALVDGGSQMTAPGKGKQGVLTGIPKDDLAIGRRQVEEGLFKTIEQWAKEYHNA